MPFGPGVKLGDYEIVALVGSGGMGEVYRARDPRLGRDVAIKVVAGVASDPERLRRFDREARAAAALNHPNILAVHDVGSANTGDPASPVPYVVAELLEGETLRQRLHAGALPLRKAIEIAIQIARGLAAAHDRGIVHRDLKPENVFITDDGRVKILDFGLAKLTEREPALSGVTAMPTAPPDTLPGIVLGTVGYMAPEQVRGRAVDHRADMFAFGTILYEMLSGRRAFQGETTADTMTAILKEDPPEFAFDEHGIPPAVARIIDRCLEKNPAARFQSAGDLAFALEALTSTSSSSVTRALVSEAPRVPGRQSISWALVAVLGVALIAAAAAATFLYLDRAPADTRSISFAATPPDGWSIALGGSTGVSVAPAPLSVSPDGRRIVFLARNNDGREVLWVRRLDDVSPQMLPGTDGAAAPFWSPDGRFIGFFASGKIKRADIAGGPPVTLADAPAATDGVWGREGVILFAIISGQPTPLMSVPAAGGIPSPATTLGNGETKHVRPVFLPDGRHFLYRMLGSTLRGGIFVSALGSAEHAHLLDVDSTNVAYSAGHILFLREGTLMAQRFDVNTRTLNGEPFPVVEPVQMVPSANSAFGMFSASENGVLAFQTGTPVTLPQLSWFDRAGKMLGVVGERARYGDLELSPDGKRVAVSLLDAVSNKRDLWLIDPGRNLRSRFTFGSGETTSPVWSPDGRRVVFASNQNGHADFFTKSADGSGTEEVLIASDGDKTPLSWSPDGRFLLFGTFTAQSLGDVWVLPMTGDRKPFAFLSSRFNEGSAHFSPDGRWVLYSSNESGRMEAYIAPFPGPGGKFQVSTTGAGQPRWRRDGSEVFYRNGGDGRLYSVRIGIEGTSVEIGEAKVLFPIPPGVGGRTVYDVTPDGQRFLVSANPAPDGDAARRPLTVVVNWPAAVKRGE